MIEELQHLDFVRVVEEEVKCNVEKAKRVLQHKIVDIFPEVAACINQTRTEYFVLMQLIKYAEEKTKHGEINEAHGSKVVAELDKKLGKLKASQPTMKKPNADQKVLDSMLTSVFGKEAIEKCIAESKLTVEVRAAEHVIQSKDQPKPATYVMVRGCVHEKEGSLEETGPHIVWRDGEIVGA